MTESLRANTGNKLYLQDDLRGKNVDKVKALATEKKVSISCAGKAYADLSEIMTKAENEENPLILILDGLTDPHNLGSILRTADATNVTGIIIPKHRSVGVTPVVSKTSTGAVEHVPIARVTNLSQTLDTLKDKEFWIFGTDMNGTPSHKWNTKGKLALVIGNEGKGISH
ncbi:RNA methyltransferase, TrmH family, group 3, partial [Streptococcus agalactiae H36B]